MKSIAQVNKDSGNFKGKNYVAENGLRAGGVSEMNDVQVSGNAVFQGVINTDTINGYTLGHGVVIEGITLKAGIISVPVTGVVQCIMNSGNTTQACANNDDTISMLLAGFEKLRLFPNGALQIGGGTTTATGSTSCAIGYQNTSSSAYAFTCGSNNVSSNNSSFCAGSGNQSTGLSSHAVGGTSIASGDYSSCEGFGGQANGVASHCEGQNNIANGVSSTASGSGTLATGDYSSAGGLNALAFGTSEWSRCNGTFTVGVRGGIQTTIVQNGVSLTALAVGNILATMPPNVQWFMEAHVTGVDFVSRDMYSEKILVNVISFGGIAVLKGSAVTSAIIKNGSMNSTLALAPQVFASGPNVVFQVTSATSSVSYWVGSFYITQVAF